jgi:hypothetical protein
VVLLFVELNILFPMLFHDLIYIDSRCLCCAERQAVKIVDHMV